MDLMKMFKRQTFIITVSIIGLSVVLLGTSYALFFRTNQSAEQQIVSTGTLLIEIPNPQQRLASDLFPKTEAQTSQDDEYTFTVSNTGTLPATYEVIIYNDSDETLTNSIEHEYLMVSFDGGTATRLSNLTRTADTADITNENNIKYILSTNNSLNPSGQSGSSATHTVKIWLDANAPSSTINKDINLEIAVNGEVDE